VSPTYYRSINIWNIRLMEEVIHSVEWVVEQAIGIVLPSVREGDDVETVGGEDS